MKDLSISLIQSDLHWQDAQANRDMFASKMASLSATTDLIILPEMFTTGFTMDASKWAEPMTGPTVAWMTNQAAKHDAVVTGSIIIAEGGNYYNRLIWMQPDGTYSTYDKRHLFAMAGENGHYAAGSERLIIMLHEWKICPLICYDLRFPVWARNDDAYDLLIYMANWPDRRSYDWNTLLRARAIENQAYVAAVNRVGTDGNGHAYAGDSCLIDPGWNKTIQHMEDKDTTATVMLSYEHLQEVRGKLPFLKDADQFSVEE